MTYLCLLPPPQSQGVVGIQAGIHASHSQLNNRASYYILWALLILQKLKQVAIQPSQIQPSLAC